MPAPDPNALTYHEAADRRPHVTAELCVSSAFFAGNSRHRKARAQRDLGNLQAGGWCCPCCGNFVPIYRRADAVYCREACRKRTAKARRKESAKDADRA
jgi:hypothetical protein